MREVGPAFAVRPSMPDDFWHFLKSHGGDWMWDKFYGTPSSRRDLSWLVAAVRNGTAIWVTDGSYDRKRAPTVSGAGWTVYCTRTRKQLICSFYEHSPKAGSYRGELLGLCAIHLFLLALEEFYDLPSTTGEIHCDNRGALHQSSWKPRRVKTGASCADVLRSIRNTKQHLKATFKYKHVNSHMDKHFLWHQLSLPQQLNCICDFYAKSSINRAMAINASRRDVYLLPREGAALVIDGIKQTSDPAKALRFAIGKRQARQFLTEQLPLSTRWTEDQFEEVAWDWLDAAMENKPDMFKIWLSKQHIGCCGTRVMTARYRGEDIDDADVDTSCPNCHEPLETAAHLCICPCDNRKRLFAEGVASLSSWMEQNNNTQHEIAYWVPKYILGRGLVRFQDLGRMSPSMRNIAVSQDIIGWRNFMEGRISELFYPTQQAHLATSSSYINGGDWMKTFISKILHITHSQWIYRNISLHDRRLGQIALTNRLEVLHDIETLMDTPSHKIPEDRRFLLEFDLDKLRNSDNNGQQYWLRAIKAARHAGRRVADVTRNSSPSGGPRQHSAIEAGRRRRSQRERLGVNDVLQSIKLDRCYIDGREAQRLYAPILAASLSRRRDHPSSIILERRDNKRRQLNPD